MTVTGRSNERLAWVVLPPERNSNEEHMQQTTLSLPELGLIAGTRGMLGFGAGLLLADRLSHGQRRPLGLALLAIGLLTTIPLALEVFGGGRLRRAEATRQPS